MAFNRGSFLLCIIAVAVVGISCRDDKSQRDVDTAAVAPQPPAITGSAGSTGWDSAIGPVLVLPIPGEPSKAAIVLPGLTDSTLAATSQFELSGIDSIALDLFSRQGLASTSVLRVASQHSNPAGCVTWPLGNLTGAVSAGWQVGVESGRASGITMDSLATMKSQDSARFVTETLEAASSLGSSGNSSFNGLPFSVRRGYRIAVSSAPVIVAEVVRKINEEANPREEHTLFLAEKESSSGRYRVKFSKRSAGREEALETSDVIVALQLKPTDRAVIVISFEYEDGGKIGLLEKFRDGSWKIRWRSAYTGC